MSFNKHDHLGIIRYDPTHIQSTIQIYLRIFVGGVTYLHGGSFEAISNTYSCRVGLVEDEKVE